MLLVPDCYLRITGENRHYGTPTNPQMPSCIPGGSSSGSAVAVAAGLVDFALGIFPPLCFALQSHLLYCSGPVLVNKMDCSFGKSCV